MNLNKNLLDTLFERQLNSNSVLKSKSYNNQIVKTYFDFNKFYKSEINFDGNSRILSKFSKDENFMITGQQEENISIWKINSDSSFSKSADINYGFSKIEDLDSNKDFTKIYCKTLDLKIIDVETSKVTNNLPFESFINDISICPLTENITFLERHGNKIHIVDDRSLDIQRINTRSVQSIQYHPNKSHLILLATVFGTYSLDLRNYKPFFHYKTFGEYNIHAKYNSTGNQILVTRRKYNPVLFNENESYPCFEFNDNEYYNREFFIKSCFAGSNDEFVVSSSVNYSIYLWEIPKKNSNKDSKSKHFTKKINSSKIVLKGHKLPVKKVFYNKKRSILASLEKESKVMLWSVFPFSTNSHLKETCFSDNTSYESTVYFRLKPNFYLYYNSITSFFDRDWMSDIFEEKDRLLTQKNYHNLEAVYSNFERSFNINYLRSIIENYKIDGNQFNSCLIKFFDDLIEKESKTDHYDLLLNQLSPLLLVKKIFREKSMLDQSVVYLTEQIELVEKLLLKIKDLKIDIKVTVLFKMSKKLKPLLADIKTVLENNKEVYVKSLCFYIHLINRVFNLNLSQNIETLLEDKSLTSKKILFFEEVINRMRLRNLTQRT